MAWRRLQSGDGKFDVNWEGAHAILRSWARYRLMARCAKLTSVPAPGSPAICNVEIDWQTVRRETDGLSDAEFRKYASAANSAIAPLISDLGQKVLQIGHDRRYVVNLMRSAQQKTMESVEAYHRVGQIGVETATTVRNAARYGLMLGAVVLSGGAALGVGAAGAALENFGSYQDAGYTHSGRHIAAFAADLVGSLIPIAGDKIAGKFADRGTRLFVHLSFVKLESAFEGAKVAIVEGKDAGTAAVKAVTHLAGGTHSEIADEIFSKKSALLAKCTLSILEEAATKGFEHLESGNEPELPPMPTAKAHWLMDATVYDSGVVEKMAIRRVANRTHSRIQ